MTEEQTRTFIPARDHIAKAFLGQHSIHGVRAHSDGIEVQHEVPLTPEVQQQISIICREIPLHFNQRPLKEEKKA